MSSDSNGSASERLASNRAFATTSWSMVLEAANGESSRVKEALSELCSRYWFPLYSFVRRKGFDSAQAEDLTQAFFAELLEKNRLDRAEPSRGKFRSFLLASLNNFILNQWRSDNASKRGGGQTILPIDYEDANHRYLELTSDELTAERVFERNWALSILEQTLAAVRQQYEQSGKLELFDSLKGMLTGESSAGYSELAIQTGMREGALKVAVHRMRQRYGQQLRLQIAKTVNDPTEVDDELASLIEALG